MYTGLWSSWPRDMRHPAEAVAANIDRSLHSCNTRTHTQQAECTWLTAHSTHTAPRCNTQGVRTQYTIHNRLHRSGPGESTHGGAAPRRARATHTRQAPLPFPVPRGRLPAFQGLPGSWVAPLRSLLSPQHTPVHVARVSSSLLLLHSLAAAAIRSGRSHHALGCTAIEGCFDSRGIVQ